MINKLTKIPINTCTIKYHKFITILQSLNITSSNQNYNRHHMSQDKVDTSPMTSSLSPSPSSANKKSP